MNSDGSTIAWMKSKGEYLEGYRGGRAENNGFQVAPGSERTTVGINFWDRLFIINTPNVPGGKMGVLLMDTQGLWDPSTDNEMNCCTYGLSCVLSSYLIANNMGVVTTEFMKCMATLTQFSNYVPSQGKQASSSEISKCSFQHLEILIRDHPNINSELTDVKCCLDEGRKQQIELETASGFCGPTSEIKSCFQSFGVTCFSHPGCINNPGFSGRMDEIKPLFLLAMGHYIEKLFCELQPRTIDGVALTGDRFIK